MENTPGRTPIAMGGDPYAPLPAFQEPCLNCDWRGRVPPLSPNRFSLSPNAWTDIPFTPRPVLVKPSSFLAGKLYARRKGTTDSGGATATEFSIDSGVDMFLHAPGQWQMFYDTAKSGASAPLNLVITDAYHVTASPALRSNSWSEGVSAEVVLTQNVVGLVLDFNPKRRYAEIQLNATAGVAGINLWIDNTVSASKGWKIFSPAAATAPTERSMFKVGITSQIGLYTGQIWGFSSNATASNRTVLTMDLQ